MGHETPLATILCVDDEPNVLEGLALGLRKLYEVVTADSATAALERLAQQPGIAVVLSDLRMPGTDGVTFLGRVRQLAPDCTRVLLTGNADLRAAIAAVNEGQIFRFLTKPCEPDQLRSALAAAVAQHRLVTAERVLLEQTLHGSVRMLTDVLSLSKPAAFGRATRIKDGASQLAKKMAAEPLWEIEVAALLSQLGAVGLPDVTLDKLYHGETLWPEEQLAANRLPAVTERLLGNIPRIEGIRAIVANQSKHFDGSGPPMNGLRGIDIPIGARILKIVLDYDILEARGMNVAVSIETMKRRCGWYDPVLLEALAGLRGAFDQIRELPLEQLESGMRFAEDVRNQAGALLIPRGYEVTDAILERLRALVVKGRVRVLVRSAPLKAT